MRGCSKLTSVIGVCIKRPCILTFCAAMASGNAYALRSDVSVGMGVDYSDNATLVESNTQDELTRIALLGIGLDEQSSVLKMNVRSLAEYLDYQDDVFDDELLLNLNGDLDWSIMPDRLNLVVRDYFTQESPDRESAFTPNNRINTNVFSAGPDLRFRLGAVDNILASARYSDYYYEDNASDSERALASIGWGHKLVRGGDLTVTLASEDVSFPESVTNDDFMRTEIYATYQFTQGRSQFRTDIGVSDIDREVNDDVDGFIGRVNWVRQVGDEKFFELDAYTQYTDSGLNLLNTGTDIQDVTLGNEQISTDILLDNNVEATYRHGAYGSSYNIGAYAREEDYELDNTLDRQSYGVQLGGDRAIMPRLTGNASISYNHYDYEFSGETQKDIDIVLGVDYRLSRKLNLAFDVSRVSRDSNFVGADYDENTALLILYYGEDPYSYR